MTYKNCFYYLDSIRACIWGKPWFQLHTWSYTSSTVIRYKNILLIKYVPGANLSFILLILISRNRILCKFKHLTPLKTPKLPAFYLPWKNKRLICFAFPCTTLYLNLAKNPGLVLDIDLLSILFSWLYATIHCCNCF